MLSLTNWNEAEAEPRIAIKKIITKQNNGNEKTNDGGGGLPWIDCLREADYGGKCEC